MSKKQKRQVINFTINDPIYKINTDVFVGERADCSVLIHKKFGIENLLDNKLAYGEAFLLERPPEIYTLVWFKNYNLYSIVHEAFHLTAFVLNCVGTKLNEDTHEPYAYYMEWLTEQINETLKKEMKKCK